MEINLKVIRKWFSARTTIGELYINDEFFCYTLEDAARAEGVKIPRETSIPTGNYKVEISKSARFKRDLPMIFTEDNGYELINKGISFKGIRFHGGNTNKNTEGCILVAYNKIDLNTIQKSSERDLVRKLKKATSIKLEVENSQIN